MAWLTGTEASFTYTNSAATLVAADFGSWTLDLDRSEASFTPFGFAMERVAVGPWRARGTLRMAVDSAQATAPPVPSGVAGTLVLKTSTDQMYTFLVVLTQLQARASMTPFDITQAAYTFRGSSAVSTDTVVAS